MTGRARRATRPTPCHFGAALGLAPTAPASRTNMVVARVADEYLGADAFGEIASWRDYPKSIVSRSCSVTWRAERVERSRDN